MSAITEKDSYNISKLLTTSESDDSESSKKNLSCFQKELLSCDFNHYEVVKLIGAGAFGQVLQCRNRITEEMVAIKFLKSDPSQEQSIMTELNIAAKLKMMNNETFHIIKSYEHFFTQNRTCLVFELLNRDLFHYLEENNIISLPMDPTRFILQQLLLALSALKNFGIVHRDLKLNNIMLIDPINRPWQVKLIDFSCARDASVKEIWRYVPPLYYRAPEVIIDAPYHVEIDMWSLGCIAAELVLGSALFAGASEYEQIKFIVEILDLPTNKMLQCGRKTMKYFNYDPTIPFYYIKSANEYQSDNGVLPIEKKRLAFRTLDHIFYSVQSFKLQESLQEGRNTRRDFLDLVKSMLTVDQERRITPEEALQHPFINDLRFNNGEARHLSAMKKHIWIKYFTSEKTVNQLIRTKYIRKM